MRDDDRIDQYDFALPPGLIAQAPATPRDASRLMVIRRGDQSIEHRRFFELPELLNPHDLLIMNDTRVVPARLIGFRTATGGKWEGLFLREEPDRRWRLIGHARGKLQAGETLTLTPATPDRPHSELRLLLEDRDSAGEWIVSPQSDLPTLELLETYGAIPLPPYLQRDAVASDRESYQTAFADRPGAVAAPTAGLHFTPDVLNRCESRGIQRAHVTLHVGLGTFRPVAVDHLSDHVMHHEWCELSQPAVTEIEATRIRQGRIVAVGTTSVRTLESAAATGNLAPWQGMTNLFIRPPYQFRSVDALITNFHLPRSTLLVLVSTFAGRELIHRAYQAAIEQDYRFYSYGDAMLIL